MACSVRLQQLQEGNDHPPLGYHGTDHPFQKVRLDGSNIGLDSNETGLGGQIALQQVDLLLRQNLGLLLGKPTSGQSLHKPVSVKKSPYEVASVPDSRGPAISAIP